MFRLKPCFVALRRWKLVAELWPHQRKNTKTITKGQTRTGTKDSLDSVALYLHLTGLTPPMCSTKTPHRTPEANSSSCFWLQRKQLLFFMNLGCAGQVKKGKFSLSNWDGKKMLGWPHFAPAGTSRVWTPLPQLAGTTQLQPSSAQSDCSSKETHLVPPGIAPADVLVVLPLNSVVKVLQWNVD